MKTSTYVSKKPDAKGYVNYTAEENKTWSTLYERQTQLLPGRACQEYIDGLKTLGLTADAIPQLPDVNEVLTRATGWAVEPVPALIGFDRFFNLLASQRFPAATFIRRPDELEYLQEPDIFHELYGHCPLLTHPTYAHFMQRYGELGVGATPHEQKKLAALYWFTVEFGLIRQPDGLRIYGGGILSSIGETPYSLESPLPERKPLTVRDAFLTPYRIDILQPVYFVIEHFDTLYDLVQDDLLARIREAQALAMHPPRFEPKDVTT